MRRQQTRTPPSPTPVHARIPGAVPGLTGEMYGCAFGLPTRMVKKNYFPNLEARNENCSLSQANAVCPRRTEAAVSLLAIQSLDRSNKLSHRAKLQPNLI